MTKRLFVAAIGLIALPACAQVADNGASRQSLSVPMGTGLAGALQDWQSLRRSEALPFAAYAQFLIAHPGWPQESALRRSAERALLPDSSDPRLVITYFSRFPPLSATAALRFAEAFSAVGRTAEATAMARKAWTLGALSTDDEARALGRFPGAFTSDDHDLRMERLLWARATTTAARQLPWTSPARRAMFDARLALLTQAPDALAKAAPFTGRLRMDPGFLMDQARYYRATEQTSAARQLLAAPRQFATAPVDPERWLDMLEAGAIDAKNNGQSQQAYDIARQLDDVYPSGIAVRDRSLAERDSYTNLAWLAGQTALRDLARPTDAIAQFERYGRAARSPQTRSKGLYWAGRAADAAGRRDAALAYYREAAKEFDQFYGQLAAERLDQPLTIPPATRSVEISSPQRDAFNRQEIVRAAEYLGATGDWSSQSLFLRQIAQIATSDVDHLLALELSKRINRPDLAVMIGRSAGVNGLRDYVQAGFPTVIPDADNHDNWTMIHAIARQESQFDRKIVSRAGARGLMQLMPGTAAETAGKVGVSYSPSNLDDPAYNIRLGDYYFSRLMNQYDGSFPLAVAAYNAGPGNVNKWLKVNGDPRVSGDILGWIEAIPFSETRGYVQNVLQNAVIYDLLHPKGGQPRKNALSAYLGKRNPG